MFRWLRSPLLWKAAGAYILLSTVVLSSLVVLENTTVRPGSQLGDPRPAVSMVLTTWICGTAATAVAGLMFLLPFRRLMRALVAEDAVDRRDQLLRLADRRDDFGTVARFLEAADQERRQRLQDIRDREQATAHSMTQVSAILQAMVEGVIAVDREERILYSNEAACRMLRFSESAMQGRSAFEILRNNHVQEAVQEAISADRLMSVEFRNPRTDARLALTVSPLSDGAGAVLVFADVTEVRRLESLRRDFVSGVGHELKTPLTVIQACTETLLDGALDDRETAQRFLRQIDEQSERLRELILGMLQLSRLESGEQIFENAVVDLRELTETVITGVRAIAENRHIRLTADGPKELFVLGDSQAIRTVIGNLVDNALKYTEDHGTVLVRLSEEPAAAVIQVIDTGVGIAEKDRQRVFERFYRVESDRNRERGGTGLGLAIVKHLCHAMNAEVTLNSRPGHGSTFAVRFPLDTTDSET